MLRSTEYKIMISLRRLRIGFVSVVSSSSRSHRDTMRFPRVLPRLVAPSSEESGVVYMQRTDSNQFRLGTNLLCD